MKVSFELDIRKLFGKLNIFKYIQNLLEQKRQLIRQQWFDTVNLITGNNPCNILQVIDVQFGLLGYKIVHTSGKVIATKRYTLPLIHKKPTEFVLNIPNTTQLLFKMYGIDIDTQQGVVSREINTEVICGKPIGFVIDYASSKMTFVFTNDKLSSVFVFGIKVCQGVLKLCEPYLKTLIK